MVNYSILLIEDNPGDVDLIKYYLTQIADKQFTLKHVDSVKAAHQLLENELFDAVLSDVNLIDSQGKDTILRVNQITQDLPLIFLTGLDNQEISLSAIQLGAQDYLVKEDINPRLLDKSIQYAIERNKSKVIIEALAIRDELTGLYNRGGMKILLSKMTAVARRHHKFIGVALIDVDQFKGINDQYGHLEGDKALKKVADILNETFRNSDIIARFGGDEFVIFFLCDEDCPSTLIRSRIQKKITQYNDSGESPWTLSISIGLNKYNPTETVDFDEMIRKVDHAMYLDKMKKSL